MFSFNFSIMFGLSRNLFNLYVKYTPKNNDFYQVFRLISNKEIGYVKSTINHDILIHNLKNVETTQNLLEIISAHHKIMNGKHLMQAFRSLFNLHKSDNSSPGDIISHPTFKTLCLSLKSNVRSIEINELIEALKILSFVGAQSNSTIIQIILQMIRQNVNSLSLQQIIFLDFLLKQFKPTPLSDALLIAFPIVFEVQLPMKMDHTNLPHLTDFLQYATKNKLSDSTVSLLLDAINANKDVNAKAALSIVWSICDFKPHEAYIPLLKKFLKIVVQHGNEYNISELETILTKLTYRYNSKYQYYFNKEFFDLVAEYVIINDLGFQQGIWILQKFNKVGYTHNALLDYISTLCHGNRKLILKADALIVFNLVSGFASTDYRPIHWESVKEGILQHANLVDGKYRIEWEKFATRLALLDIFLPNVMQKSLQEEYINKLVEKGSFESIENFLILYQTICTLKPEYNSLLPNISYVNKAVEVYVTETENNFRPLQPALERGFGGESYVLQNVKTKLGHLLHHVVVMRKGGYPVAHNKSEIKNNLILEELYLPIDSHVITIFGCNSSYYKLDSNVLQNIYSLMFRTIESSGYSVVPVCLNTWTTLPDYEKIPYLMRCIRIKNEEFEKLSVVL